MLLLLCLARAGIGLSVSGVSDNSKRLSTVLGLTIGSFDILFLVLLSAGLLVCAVLRNRVLRMIFRVVSTCRFLKWVFEVRILT